MGTILNGMLIFLVLYLFWRINRYETLVLETNQRLQILADKMVEKMSMEEKLEFAKTYNRNWQVFIDDSRSKH